MSVNPDHQPATQRPLTDPEGNVLPPLEVRSPAPNFGDDAQGERLRQANRAAEEAKKRRRNIILASIAGGAVLIGGGTTAALLSGNSDQPNNGSDKNTSALPNKPEVKHETKEAVVGQAGSTLDNISVKPSQELINEALQPVTVAEFPTAEDALRQFGRIDNIANLAATVDTESGSTLFPEEAESIALRKKLWENMYSPEGLASLANPDSKLPGIIAMELWYINDAGTVPLPKDTAGTWHVDWIPEHIDAGIDNTYDTTVTIKKTTNFQELDDMTINNIPDIAPIMEYSSHIILSNDGETWKIDLQKSLE